MTPYDEWTDAELLEGLDMRIRRMQNAGQSISDQAGITANIWFGFEGPEARAIVETLKVRHAS